MWPILGIYFGVMPTVIVLCGAWLIRDYQRTVWLERFGSRVKGEIVNRRVSLFTRPQFFFVTYRFPGSVSAHSSVVYTREQRIQWQTYRRLKDITDVDIVYAPNNPRQAQLAGQYSDHVDRLYALSLGLPVAIIWCGLLASSLRMLQG
jgi:hypothetical protein